MQKFHRSLWLGFALLWATGLFSLWQANLRASARARPSSPFPAESSDHFVATAEEAKIRHLFWTRRTGAVDLIGNPRLFESIFPGYGPARTNRALWSRYFEEIFDQGIFSEALDGKLSAASDGISTSWLGSLDIYKNYGADLLLVGKSETFNTVPPGFLYAELGRLGYPVEGKKILQCSKGNLVPAALADVLDDIVGTRPKASIAVWGYSIDTLHRATQFAQIQEDLRQSINAWRARNFVSRFDRRFPHPSWNLFIGPGRQEHAEAAERFLIPDAVANDPRALEKMLYGKDAPDFSIGFEEKDCDFSTASREVDQALAQLLKVSDKVLLFLPPTTPLNRRRAPPCLMPGLTAMLHSKASPRVFVETSDWDVYDLTYRDYLYPSKAGKGFWIFDTNHVNGAGARKSTSRIAQWIMQAESKPESARP